jgi:hypothetical protein
MPDVNYKFCSMPHFHDEEYSIRQAPTFRHAQLSDDEFLRLWSEGKPVVITDIAQQGTWGPDYFMERYGDTEVTIEDCETGELRKTTVRSYFQTYVESGERNSVWKLKVRPVFITFHGCRS